MILGMGIDLIEVERIARAIEKQHFLERLFSPEERAAIAQKGAQTAAGYFAAKEAVAKALGTGFIGFGPNAIHVENDEMGAPHAVLSGGALRRLQDLGADTIHLSITHTAQNAAAVAIVEKR